jgi:putative DNA methylase
MKYRKKLIEVALPLDAINRACAREKSIRHGHPSTLHLWWARRPLAAARAVIFSQMVDDPSAVTELFPNEAAQDKERARLFALIEELVKWENTTNEKLLKQAQDEIWKSWRRACEDNKDHPKAKEFFDSTKLPAFHDPFAGGGALPLEAQRLGLESYASDLNPVAVLINKAMIEIPPKFAGMPPINPESRRDKALIEREWKGAQGLAEDVRYYGKWMRDEAEKRIGHLYPKVKITEEMINDPENPRPDLEQYKGQELTVIAWIWARTVKSPNPAFKDVDVPLASTFMLSTKKGKEAYVEPIIENGGYRFTVKNGKPRDEGKAKKGTKSGSSGSSFLCLMSDTPMPFDSLRATAKAGGMKAKLMAIVAEGTRGRVYLSPTPEMEQIALSAKPTNVPDTNLPEKALGFRVQEYGMTRWCDLFTNRQLVALTTFSDLVSEAREKIIQDAFEEGLVDDGKGLEQGGLGAKGYAEAVSVYLGCGISRLTNRSSTLNFWDTKGENVQQVFARQALAMTWDYVEGNAFSESTGNFVGQLTYLINAVLTLPSTGYGMAIQSNASTQVISESKIVSTDPPYFDNIGYADLSDYFYVWLRRAIEHICPLLFSTLAVPKNEELVAVPYRHGGKGEAEIFFMHGMTRAMERLSQLANPLFPVTIYYAFKQSETDSKVGTASTGWETFIEAIIKAGFAISGTWPIRTEYIGNLKKNISALASSIVLVCYRRDDMASTATRREFISALRSELPEALLHLQRGNIAPVDLAQASIGPGMAVFTRYEKVIDAEGNPVTVRDALTLINQVLDEVLAEQEGDFDSDTRWALSWFEQYGFDAAEYGVAETLSTAKNTSVSGLVEAGIILSKGGKVRLLKPTELAEDWDPEKDKRLTVWEMVHYLIRAISDGGESMAAGLVSKLGGKAETARELAYRLYTICERKKWATDALSYNGLVQSWPEIVQLARSNDAPKTERAVQVDALL